jgi:hypothetical protein
MKLLKPKNSDFCSESNGNLSIQRHGVCELIKADVFPIVIQFDCAEDFKTLAQQISMCNL